MATKMDRMISIDSLKPDDEFDLAASELCVVNDLLQNLVVESRQQFAVQFHHLVTCQHVSQLRNGTDVHKAGMFLHPSTS